MSHVLTFMTRINRQLLTASSSEASGGPTCSYLIFYSLMMLILWCFLLLTHFLCHVHPQECDTKFQYKDNNSVRCCKKCPLGQRMRTRCSNLSDTVCTSCRRDLYMDEYNQELECKRCSQCTKEHMVYKKNCSSVSDAVCDCESGYKCNSKPCTDCVKIPIMTTTTTTPTTTTTTTTTTTSKVITNVIKEATASQDTHLHVDGSCWLQLVLLGDPRNLQPNLVSAQRMRKCRCQSRRCVNIRSGKKKSEGDRGKRRDRGRKRHIRVWIDYEL
ncbi:tumor necrosis factor receptor superfamily member 23 isoform X1 [Ictalurus punctatus]|uniref:Tumor necrosis factor receptor superfamily member 23 isoform X1 n=1 Tax=Ictalurus punctatus TaxID=7998 RepID=A0A2D0RDW9_ICTPU|nr:tumor necrosis factor receptor superfamily member 23 isoform X1 [Ictalurus punctatus]